MPAETAEGLGPCPQCGEKLRRWPTLDGSGHLVSCNACSYESSVGRLDEASTASASQSTSDAAPGPARFRQLLAAQKEASPSDLPLDLLDELPAAARQVLASSGSQRDQEQGELPDEMQQYLRQRGYFVSVEHGGPRLSSGGGRRPGSADLSPYELVRMASEMGRRRTRARAPGEMSPLPGGDRGQHKPLPLVRPRHRRRRPQPVSRRKIPPRGYGALRYNPRSHTLLTVLAGTYAPRKDHHRRRARAQP